MKTILKNNTKTKFYILKKGKWIKRELNSNHLGSKWVRLYGHERIGIIDKEAKKEMFSDWFNNFLTKEKFAEHYQISESNAIKLINEAREYFDLA